MIVPNALKRAIDFFVWPIYLFIWPIILAENLLAVVGWPITLAGTVIMTLPNIILDVIDFISKIPLIAGGLLVTGIAGGATYLVNLIGEKTMQI